MPTRVAGLSVHPTNGGGGNLVETKTQPLQHSQYFDLTINIDLSCNRYSSFNASESRFVGVRGKRGLSELSEE